MVTTSITTSMDSADTDIKRVLPWSNILIVLEDLGVLV